MANPFFLAQTQFYKVDFPTEVMKNIGVFLMKHEIREPTPTARVMKGVSIPVGWRKELRTMPGTMIRVGAGRSMVNPCEACEMAENCRRQAAFGGLTGTDNYCGQCRSRPTALSFRTVQADDGFPLSIPIYLFSLSAHGLARSGDSPRTTYVRNLQNFTCPNCGEIYRHSMRQHDFIEMTGECEACHYSLRSVYFN